MSSDKCLSTRSARSTGTRLTNKAMVAVCDILGFSDLVRQRPLDEMINYHIANYHNLIKASIPSTSKDQQLVGVAVFSDTVLIFSLADNKHSYDQVIYSAVSILAQPMLYPEYRFRIGISYGDFYHDAEKSIYVGKALVEAHELERKQNWSGGALTKEAKEVIGDNHFLTECSVPIKGDDEEVYQTHCVINWTLAEHDVITEQICWLNRNDYLVSLSEKKRQKIERMLQNTERFHNENCVQCGAVRKAYNQRDRQNMKCDRIEKDADLADE
jgi:hypothetical protein